MYPESIEKLIKGLSLLPGIGEKTATRLAFYIIDMDDDQVDFLNESIKNAKKNIHRCRQCNNITDLDICNICSDDSRDKKTVFVTSDPKTVFLLEETKEYNGLYYVLNGLISPINGVNPEDIGLEQLVKLINENNVKEVILGLKSSIEGKTTVFYIKKILSDKNIKITRMAEGIPLGVDLEYIDSPTLEKAFIDRKEIE